MNIYVSFGYFRDRFIVARTKALDDDSHQGKLHYIVILKIFTYGPNLFK